MLALFFWLPRSSLCSPSGHKKLASIVGVAVFCQYWFWYPLTHFLSLAFTPTAVMGLNADLQMPKNWTFLSNAKPAVFAYHPPMPPKKEAEVVKVATAQVCCGCLERCDVFREREMQSIIGSTQRNIEYL
jgi:hypothetical protein